MNRRIRKKLNKRLGFFHYKDYREYINRLNCNYNDSGWSWTDFPLSQSADKPDKSSALVGGAWNLGQYCGYPIILANTTMYDVLGKPRPLLGNVGLYSWNYGFTSII